MTIETIFQNVTEGKLADVESGVQAALIQVCLLKIS